MHSYMTNCCNIHKNAVLGNWSLHIQFKDCGIQLEIITIITHVRIIIKINLLLYAILNKIYKIY